MVNVTAKDNRSGEWLQLPVWDEEGQVTVGVMWPPQCRSLPFQSDQSPSQSGRRNCTSYFCLTVKTVEVQTR